MAKKGDVVLVVGKGHEDFQEYWDGITEGATVKVGGLATRVLGGG